MTAPRPKATLRAAAARLARRAIFTIALPAAAAALAGPGPQLDLPRVELRAGMHRIDAQLAQTQEQRQTGLMERSSMPQHEGMLFVFGQAGQQCFWMKDTPLPLTAAFIADDGSIVNLADMQPRTLDAHCSARPVRYVLEMNQGWFARKGIKPGTRLAGAPFRRD